MDQLLPPTLIGTAGRAGHHDLATNGDGELVAFESTLRHVVLSPDGTTVISSSLSESVHSSTVRSVILPPDLLHGNLQSIKSYSTMDLPEPVRAMIPYPGFDLSDPSTTLLLLSLPDHPARLVNTLAFQSGIVASYPYVRPETEETIAAHSLLFAHDGNHFLAGTDSEVSMFDLNRPGQDAMQRFKLRRNGRLGQPGQWRMKRGIVSSLAISSDQVLAVGTFGREISLFERNGRGDSVGSFELGNEAKGSGISQISWTGCGRYLLTSERKSDVIHVFDIRGQQKHLQTLVGHDAKSMMRLQWDITSNGEIWAGGMDGTVRVWEGIGMSEGNLIPTGSWKAHEYPVISTMVHDSGSVVITASAKDRNKSYHEENLDNDDGSSGSEKEDEEEDLEAPIAVWALSNIAQTNVETG
jgi:WD40 repeat protein